MLSVANRLCNEEEKLTEIAAIGDKVPNIAKNHMAIIVKEVAFATNLVATANKGC